MGAARRVLPGRCCPGSRQSSAALSRFGKPLLRWAAPGDEHHLQRNSLATWFCGSRRSSGRIVFHILPLFPLPFGFSRPTFLVVAPWNIRPGANVTVGVALLPDSPAQVTVRGEVIRDNETIFRREMVFEKGKSLELAWEDPDLVVFFFFFPSTNISLLPKYHSS